MHKAAQNKICNNPYMKTNQDIGSLVYVPQDNFGEIKCKQSKENTK